MKVNKAAIAIAILVILHVVGIVGAFVFSSDMLKLTPIHLIVCCFLVGAFHPTIDARFVWYAAIVYIAGFLLEAIGVATGSIFGQYFYGENLGIKVFETPLIIGLNWLMLSYCTSIIASRVTAKSNVLNKSVIKALIATLLMVAIDVLIEHIASFFDFWYWKNQIIPLQNYTAWFAFAFAFNFLFQKLEIDTSNKVAPWLYVLQLLFFIGLNLVPVFS